MVLVADTYNHKIKVIDPFRNEVFTWLGNGKAGIKDENTFNGAFNEPSGFASLFDPARKDIKIYIADCNNHAIRMVYYDQGDTQTVELRHVPPVATTSNTDPTAASQGGDEGETEGTTNKSNLDEGDPAMGLECDGQNCYPKFF